MENSHINRGTLWKGISNLRAGRIIPYEGQVIYK